MMEEARLLTLLTQGEGGLSQQAAALEKIGAMNGMVRNTPLVGERQRQSHEIHGTKQERRGEG